MATNKIVANLQGGLQSRARVAANSASFGVGDLVGYDADGFIIPAVAATTIEGISNETYVAASDNETVAKYAVSFTAARPGIVLEMEISGGTIAQEDEGELFDVSDANTVDGTTEGTGTHLKLVKFISATLGQFEVA